MHTIYTLTATLLMAGVTLVSCSGKHEGDRHELHAPDAVKSVAEALLNDSAKAFASAVSYPLSRPYPLKDIPDSETMVKYYPTMVDDSLRHSVTHAPDSLWSDTGWRGWTLDLGEYFWIEDGKIYAMDYVSKAERHLLDSLRKEEIASLAPHMRRGWVPVGCIIDSVSGTVFRIDSHGKVTTDTLTTDSLIYRFAVYSVDQSLGDAPAILLYGELNEEGTMGSRFYHFKDSAGTVADYTPDIIPEDSVPTIEIESHGKALRYHARPGYWLDIIKKDKLHRGSMHRPAHNPLDPKGGI